MPPVNARASLTIPSWRKMYLSVSSVCAWLCRAACGCHAIWARCGGALHHGRLVPCVSMRSPIAPACIEQHVLVDIFVAIVENSTASLVKALAHDGHARAFWGVGNPSITGRMASTTRSAVPTGPPLLTTPSVRGSGLVMNPMLATRAELGHSAVPASASQAVTAENGRRKPSAFAPLDYTSAILAKVSKHRGCA